MSDPAGTNGQIQYNSNGAFAAANNIVTDGIGIYFSSSNTDANGINSNCSVIIPFINGSGVEVLGIQANNNVAANGVGGSTWLFGGAAGEAFQFTQAGIMLFGGSNSELSLAQTPDIWLIPGADASNVDSINHTGVIFVGGPLADGNYNVGNNTALLMSQGPGLPPLWTSLETLKALLANT